MPNDKLAGMTPLVFNFCKLHKIMPYQIVLASPNGLVWRVAPNRYKMWQENMSIRKINASDMSMFATSSKNDPNLSAEDREILWQSVVNALNMDIVDLSSLDNSKYK